MPTTRVIQPGGFATLSTDHKILALVADTAAASGVDAAVVDTASQLPHVIAGCAPRAVVIDREHMDADTAIRQLDALSGTSTILLMRDTVEDPPPGTQLVVFKSSLAIALDLATRPRALEERRPPPLDLLLTVSLLSGPLEVAFETASEQLARAFGVDHCVISVRGAASGGDTSDPSVWNHVERCRMAAASAATVLAMTVGLVEQCESFLAVPLDTPLGSHGFLGLVAKTARIFAAEDRATLQAIASKLGAELGWRGVHDRTADELARLASGPGLDPLVGAWNHVAMVQLMSAAVSSATRSNQAVTALVLDIVDLHGINARYGLKVGDLMLRRIADTVRDNIRIEDLVGRWAGHKILVVLQDVNLERAQEVAEHLRTALAAHPIELATGERLDIPVTIGLAVLHPSEEPSHMVARAIAAARVPADGHAIAAASAAIVPQLEAVDDPPVTLAGTYRLRHEISRGAMGVVYRADDQALERPVAIKMLRPDLAEDHVFIERLRAEAVLLARIQHPNLVQIYSFSQQGGDSFLVMELVEGESLQEAIERHEHEGTPPPPLAVIIALIEEVASALDALHERGIIHRDVKPGNIIRDPFRRRGVLVDVGIAHRAGQATETAGTPGYIAPEVVAGGEATAQSDVYGLAATAYAILTLIEPFGDGAMADILARQNSDEPPARPSSHVADLELADDVILAALHRDPAQRPASAGEFAHALSKALSFVAPATPTQTQMRQRDVRGAPRPDTSGAQPQTRGVVFRSVSRVLGVHEAARFRFALDGHDPDLAQALSDTPPLSWLPTEMFARLLAVAPQHLTHLDLDGPRLARDVARASVRASFRRFFPSSAATLIPERTLSAIRNVWARYQSWGAVVAIPVSTTASDVRITGTPRNADLCAWTTGMLEQLVVLSGGRNATVEHDACEALGADACWFRTRWEP